MISEETYKRLATEAADLAVNHILAKFGLDNLDAIRNASYEQAIAKHRRNGEDLRITALRDGILEQITEATYGFHCEIEEQESREWAAYESNRPDRMTKAQVL